jgi:flavodoxin
LKVLIVYDSVSPNQNTKKIADTLSMVLEEKGIKVDSFRASYVDKDIVKNYDCLLVGSPTMAWSATAPAKEFLEGLKTSRFDGKFAAAFDTRIKSFISGQAAKGIQESLEKLGFRIIVPPLAAYVEGSRNRNDYTLKEGELEKARKFAEDIAEDLKAYFQKNET